MAGYTASIMGAGGVDRHLETMCVIRLGNCLGAEAVQGLAVALERVHDVEGRDGLAAGVLRVRHGILDNVLEERLQDTAGLLVHETGDALDAATAGQTADSGLRDALDVVAKDLAMALGAALATLASLAATGHVCFDLQMNANYFHCAWTQEKMKGAHSTGA